MHNLCIMWFLLDEPRVYTKRYIPRELVSASIEFEAQTNRTLFSDKKQDGMRDV